MSKEIKSIEYLFTPEDEESVLTSHWFDSNMTSIMIWGDLHKNIPFETWKAGLSPERKAEILKEGFSTRGLTFGQTGNLSHLMGENKKKYDNGKNNSRQQE